MKHEQLIPTWSGLLPAMLASYLHNGRRAQSYTSAKSAQVVKDLTEEFTRMARQADLWLAHHAKLERDLSKQDRASLKCP